MQYSSTFVRYERSGDRVVPVRVTKQWVSADPQRAAGKPQDRKFATVRLTELRWLMPRDPAPEPWQSSSRVESRERVLTLNHHVQSSSGSTIREPVLWPAFEGEDCLEIGDPASWSADQVNQPLEAEPESREWYLRREWAESRGYHDDDELEAA